MSAGGCRVHHVRLRAASDALVRRGALLLEDALRTMTPPAGGRLLVVRSLALGRIPAGASPATLALLVEERLRELAAGAVPADDPSARAASAVWFRDETAPWVRLAERVAAQRPADEWFWRRAAPGWSAALSRDEALRALLFGALATAPGPVAGASVVGALAARGTLAALLGALRWPDGPSLLRASGWGGVDAVATAHAPGAPSLAAPFARALAEWTDRWGAGDARSAWLAATLLTVERPAMASASDLPRRVSALLAATAAARATARGEEREKGDRGPVRRRAADRPDGRDASAREAVERPPSAAAVAPRAEDATATEPPRVDANAVRPPDGPSAAAPARMPSPAPPLPAQATDRTMPRAAAEPPRASASRPAPTGRTSADRSADGREAASGASAADAARESASGAGDAPASSARPRAPEASSVAPGAERVVATPTAAGSVDAPPPAAARGEERSASGHTGGDEPRGPDEAMERAARRRELLRAHGAREDLADAEPAPSIEGEFVSPHAGLLHLCAAMSRLGMGDFLDEHPRLLELDLATRLLRHVARRLAVPAADPVHAALASPGADESADDWDEDFVMPGRWRELVAGGARWMARPRGPRHVLTDGSWRLVLAAWRDDEPAAARALRAGVLVAPGPAAEDDARPIALVLDAWTAALRRWCRQLGAIGLGEVVRRRGRIGLTRTHLDVIFPFGSLDVRIRRAGLDVDPGWLPWMGKVVHYHYEEGARVR